MNETVIEKAKELAKALASSDEYLAMRAAEAAGTKDEKMAAAFARYSELQGQVREVSLREAPDFQLIGALSRELETVQDEIQHAPAAIRMQEARKQFSELMTAVNEELSKVLNPDPGKGTSGCTGNCAACGGCNS